MLSIADLLKPLLNGNQFASGGLFLLVLGGIATSLKKVPTKIFTFLLNQISMRVIILDTVDGFLWFQRWISKSKQGKKARQLDLFTPYVAGKLKISFNLAPGIKWLFYKGRPIRVSFTRTESTGAGNDTTKRIESIEIFTFGRNRKFLENFILEIREAYIVDYKHIVQLFNFTNGAWRESPGFIPRSLDSVILPSGVKERFLFDIKNFYTSKNWYKEMGIPFHRGYLLHGIPGSGKTALITGLAHELKCRIYIIKLNELTDAGLSWAVGNCSESSIILLEDVDTVVPEKRRAVFIKQQPDSPTASPSTKNSIEEQRGVTLGGLLNVLDGLESPTGVLFFLTTNNPEKLDPALLRPGRIDMKEEFGPALAQQKEELYKRFFPTKSIDKEIITNHGVVSMAEFQELLLRERNSLQYGEV